MVLGNVVFHDIPKLKEEIEVNSMNTLSQLNTLKFKKADADETGTDPEKMNWLLTTKLYLIDKIQLLKNNGAVLSQGVIDYEADIDIDNVNHSITIKMRDMLPDGFDEEVTYSCGKTFYEIVGDIRSDYLSSLGILAISRPPEEDWKKVRPVDDEVADTHPFYMHDNLYVVNWDGLSIKEVLRQICILGNCRIIISGITMIIKLNVLRIGESAITPDGKLVITKEPLKKPDDEAYSIDMDTLYKVSMLRAYADNRVDAGGHDKDAEDLESIWLDANSNQWKLVTLLVDEHIQFEHYPDDPQGSPGYEMPASGTLTHISGATHTSDIVYTGAEIVPTVTTYDDEDIKTMIDNYYDLDSYMQFYHLEGLNSNVDAGDIFELDSKDMQATMVERDLRFIEEDLQPVNIEAIDRSS